MTYPRNELIDYWIDSADSPEVAKHFQSPDLMAAAQGRSDRLQQIRNDTRRHWINGVFWQMALPPRADRVFFPRLGIYEILRQHNRVLDFQGAAIRKELLAGFEIRHMTCAASVAERIGPMILEMFPNADILTHNLFNDFYATSKEIFKDKDPNMGNIIFCLQPSIQIGAEILIPDPAKNLVLENFSL